MTSKQDCPRCDAKGTYQLGYCHICGFDRIEYLSEVILTLGQGTNAKDMRRLLDEAIELGTKRKLRELGYRL